MKLLCLEVPLKTHPVTFFWPTVPALSAKTNSDSSRCWLSLASLWHQHLKPGSMKRNNQTWNQLEQTRNPQLTDKSTKFKRWGSKKEIQVESYVAMKCQANAHHTPHTELRSPHPTNWQLLSGCVIAEVMAKTVIFFTLLLWIHEHKSWIQSLWFQIQALPLSCWTLLCKLLKLSKP